MPNWCHNVVTVTGDAEQVRCVVEEVASHDTAFSLNSILPGVEGDENWYEWRVEHWGTKWDVEAAPPTLVEVGDQLAATWVFSSAWSPPSAALEVLASRYPVRVCTTHSEEGNAFWGGTTWHQGQEWDAETAGPHPAMVIETGKSWVLVDVVGQVSVHASIDEACAVHTAELDANHPTLLMFGPVTGRVEPTADMFVDAVEGVDGDAVVARFASQLEDDWGRHCAGLYDAVTARWSSGEHVARWAVLGYLITRDDEFWFSERVATCQQIAILEQLSKHLPNAQACVQLLDQVMPENVELAKDALEAAVTQAGGRT